MKKIRLIWAAVLVTLSLLLPGCGQKEGVQPLHIDGSAMQEASSGRTLSLEELPEFGDTPYLVLENNEPDFTQEDFADQSYESYGDLDELGRCTGAIANIGTDLMPVEERGNIGQVKPTGWHTVKYEGVDGKYLYNRCHLIGFQLTGENANEQNLITGTRYLNVEGMLPFENMVADYVKETGNHVLYRVTPIYEGDNLVASGVQMEAKSVEDEGEGICFNIYAFNSQPGISIDYKTGESRPAGQEDSSDREGSKIAGKDSGGKEYILNTKTHKFHLPSCSSADEIKPQNKDTFKGDREELISLSYDPCKRCRP